MKLSKYVFLVMKYEYKIAAILDSDLYVLTVTYFLFR